MTWSTLETAVLARAINRAPSVHHTQPWILDFPDDSVELYERPEQRLPEHDPLGRDRLISCGAALANLELAIRALGRDVSVSLLPDPRQPELLGRMSVTGLREAAGADIDRYSAIFQRRSYRSPFSLREVTRADLRAVSEAGSSPGVQLRGVDRRTESAPLAELLRHAASVLGDDLAYQRELEAWAVKFPQALPAGSSIPWAGLVRTETTVPDVITLTQRLMVERLLMFLTPGDTRRDHVLAGVSMQRVWLTALTRGLVASVVTQPLGIHEVRTGMIERFDLAGYPQLILRVGYPTT